MIPINSRVFFRRKNRACTGTVVAHYPSYGEVCTDEETGEEYVVEDFVGVLVDEPLPAWWGYINTNRFAPSVNDVLPLNESVHGKFVLTDAGRSGSRRPKQKLDCTVRAYAVAASISYDEAYELLASAGRQSGKRFRMQAFFEQHKPFAKLSFPAVKGQPRMNVSKFCETYPQGTYVIKTAKHVMAVVDGVLHDDMAPAWGKCVYTAWLIQPSN